MAQSAGGDIRVIFKPEGVKDVIDGLRLIQKEAAAADRSGAGFSGSFVDIFAKQGPQAAKSYGDALRANVIPSLNEIRAVATRLIPVLGFAGAITGIVSLGTEALTAARQVGPLAETLRISAEQLTILQFAARGNSATTDQLDKGLGNLNKTLRELRDGTQNQVDAFASLGLSAKDFQGLDLAQSLELIAQRLAKIDASKVDLDAILGRDARKLIPLLNAVAKDGLGGLEKAAREANAVISTETAKAGREFDDNLQALTENTKGWARSLVADLLPQLRDATAEMLKASKSGGVFAAAMVALRKNAAALGPLQGPFLLLDKLLSGNKPEVAAPKLSPQQSGSIGKGAVGGDDPEKRIDGLARLGKLQAQIREAEITGLRAQADAADQAAAAQLRLAEASLKSDAGKRFTQQLADVDLARREQAAQSLFNLETQIATDKERKLKELADKQVVNAKEREATIVEIVKQSTASQIQQASKYLGELTRLLDQNVQRHKEASGRIQSRNDEVLAQLDKTDAQFGKPKAAAPAPQTLAGINQQAKDLLGTLQQIAQKGDFEGFKKARADLDGLVSKVGELGGQAFAEPLARQADELFKKASIAASAADQATAASSQAAVTRIEAQIETVRTKINTLSEQQVTLNVSVSGDQLTRVANDIREFLQRTPFSITVAAQVQAAGGAALEGFAGGGRIPGTAPHPRADNTIIAATPGEFMHQVAAVRHYGLGFMESVNRMTFPRFGDGGLIGGGDSAAPAGLMEHAISVGGRRVGGIFGPRDKVSELVDAIQRELG